MSLLDQRGPALLPGEDHIRLKPDPYFGSVDVGDGPTRVDTPRAAGERLQREVTSGAALLDGDEQNRVEVITGKRLQQRAGMKREDLPPSELPAPTLTSLAPNTAVLGSTDFTLRVVGTGFVEGSVIVFAGHDEPTTFESDHDLTTGVDMSVWLGPDPAIPVLVRNPDDQATEPLMFSFTGTAPARSAAKPERPGAGRPDIGEKPDHTLPEHKPTPKR